ncbi:MAG: OsmC family protein [Candidatus Helarchaeota archaeon]|nr:OsmC family protein [Candidatus Helarchaeota archaeon]
MLNRINLEEFKKIQDKYGKDLSQCKKTLEVKGQWLLEEDSGPQFETKLRTERAGLITVRTDETIILGGGGTAVHPVHYCMAGLCGCFSAAFAKWAGMTGIELRKFEIRAVADIDLTAGFGLGDGVPAVDKMTLELTVDCDASPEELNEVIELTKKRCFCYFCMTTPIIPEIALIREIPAPELELIHTICPTCFEKTMAFTEEGTQVCNNCGEEGIFVRIPETGEIILK